MKASKLSFWNNKWNEIYDFTPNKLQSKGLNYSLISDKVNDFVVSLDKMTNIMS